MCSVGFSLARRPRAVTTRVRVRSEFGDYSKTGKGRRGEQDKAAKQEDSEVLNAQAQPLQDLWASASLSAEVRALPSVFPRIGIARRDSGRFEVVLVGKHVASRRLPVPGDHGQVSG